MQTRTEIIGECQVCGELDDYILEEKAKCKKCGKEEGMWIFCFKPKEEGQA